MSDNREVDAYRGDERQVAVPGRSDSFLAMLLEAARDPAIDASKVKTMADLAIQLQDRERESQFAKDFAAALMEMPYISKRGAIIIPAKDGRAEREQGKFATFEDLDKVVRPILARHNMVISFKLGSDQGTTATPILTHTNGYRDVGDALRVPPDTSGSKNAAQAIGSSSSYAKRYAMCAALNIVTVGEDDDGASYPLASDPLTDRQERLIKEAEASHADGNYAAWYGKQRPSDRAWLVIKGVHGRLGGATLPDASGSTRSPPPSPPPPSPSPSAAPPKAEKRDTSTPEGWTEQYREDCANATTMEQLEAVKRRGARGLERLSSGHMSLYDRCDVAFEDAKERIQRADSGLFSGED